MNNKPVALTQVEIMEAMTLGIPLYTHPAKELYLSLQKDKETGELLAVTYTDDEHRIVEVLWQKPPAKEHFEDEPQAEELHEIMQSNAELTDEEIHQAIRRGFARDGFLSDGIFLEIKELLRNKQGVNSEQVPDFFFMENDLMGKR